MNTFLNRRVGRGRAGLRGFLFRAGVFTLCVNACFAVDPHRSMSQYVHTRWGTERGFPAGPVYAISQTSDGYLWIGTGAGLVRFDGLHFTLIQDSTRTFVFSGVIGLTPDNHGGLWLRLRDLTLLYYRNGEFSKPFSNPEEGAGIFATARTATGDLLAAREQSGIFSYRAAKLALIAPAAGVPRSPITAIAMTGDGSAWLGTRGAGLFQLKAGVTHEIKRGLPDPKINCLLADGAKDLWVGTDLGLARWNGLELSTRGLPGILTKSQVLTLVKDRDGNLWTGTDAAGLVRYNAEGASSLDPAESDADKAVTALFEDRERNIWIGRADGIERLSDSPFITYSMAEGLPTDGSNPVWVGSDARTWFPPVEGGLWWFKNGRHESITQAGLPYDIVYSLAGGADDLWIGRRRGGLTKLHWSKGVFTARTYTKADGLAQNSVYSVYLSRSGAVWAGTLSGGVSRLDHGVFTTYTMADGLATNTVASMLESNDGTMWFATPSGLSSFAKERWKSFTRADGLPSENINCLLEDSAGVLWAGTSAGLAYRAAGKFAIPARAPAAVHDPIFGVVEDGYGFLWVATANRVLRVNRKKLFQGNLGEGDVLEFGTADGLRGTEGVKRHQSVIKDPQGRVWMSLNRGIAVVDPAWLTARSIPSIPQVEALSADNVSLGLSGPVRVPHGRQRVTLGYAGLSLTAPERVRFRYRLEGFDRSWSQPVTEREAVYTNLGPGSYRFRLLASNPNGAWSPQEAVLAFSVDPEWWQTWWFRVSLLFGCLVSAAAFYRLRLRQTTTRLNVRFEERLAERTRIAQELHDTLLQGFISASMQVHVAVGRLPAESNVKPDLARSIELMREMIDEGRNAVRGLRGSAGEPSDLETAFSQLQEEVNSRADEEVEFRVISEGKPKTLHPLLRDEVYRIGREALLNAFRHSGAKLVEIELKYSSRSLQMVVRDDGRGIDAKTVLTGSEGHWGIVGMRERSTRIGGKFRLHSGANHGTEVELTIPGQIAYQDRPPAGRKR